MSNLEENNTEKEGFACFSASSSGEAETPSEVNNGYGFLSSSFDYKPFGSDNLFPQAWEVYLKTSGTARSIVRRKTIISVGEGYDREGLSTKLSDYLDEVNEKEESIEEIKEKLYSDYYRSGNAYIEIVKGEAFNSLHHHDWTKCRYSRSGQEIMIHPNWADYESTKSKTVTVPLYPKFGKVKGKKGLRSIVHIKGYEPEFSHYGMPDPIASKNAMAVGYKTTQWNRSRVDNGMNLSGILMFNGKYTPEQATKIKKRAEKELTGANNQGKVMAIVKELGSNGKEGTTEFIPIGSSNDGDWDKLHQQADTEIIIGFNWFRSLTSLPYTTGFSTEVMQDEYYTAIAIEIGPVQKKFSRKLRKVLKKHLKLDIDLKTINKPPFPIHRTVNATNVTAFKVGEIRASAGFSYDDSDDYHNSYMKAAKEKEIEDTEEKKKESENKKGPDNE